MNHFQKDLHEAWIHCESLVRNRNITNCLAIRKSSLSTSKRHFLHVNAFTFISYPSTFVFSWWGGTAAVSLWNFDVATSHVKEAAFATWHGCCHWKLGECNQFPRATIWGRGESVVDEMRYECEAAWLHPETWWWTVVLGVLKMWANKTEISNHRISSNLNNFRNCSSFIGSLRWSLMHP